MTDMHDTADLVSKALRRAWQLGQTYWQQADSEYQSHWKKADATQATFDQLVEATRAAILTSNSGAKAAPTALLVAAANLVAQMEIVSRVGFVDTPDDKDSCAAFCVAEGTWLELMSTVESLASALAVMGKAAKRHSAQPAPSMPEVTDAMALAFHHALTDGSIGAREVEEIKDALRAALAAAPEAKP